MKEQSKQDESTQATSQVEKTENWEISSSSWNPKKRRWKKKPKLIIDGKKFKFSTPHGYIKTMKERCLPGESYSEVISYLEDLIGKYSINPPLKKNVFTYIAMAIIFFFFADAAFQWSEAALSVNPDEKIIPLNFWMSNFFWFLTFIGILYTVFFDRHESYSVMTKGAGGEWTESMDMMDQMQGVISTVFMPLAKGAGYALFPYYIAYLIINFIAGISTFLLVFFIVLTFVIIMWVFIKTRPIDKRRKEVFWAFKWFSLYIALSIFTFYMGVYQ